VIFRTHPSGDPTPSDAVLQFTRRISYTAALVGVDLVDHLVLGAIGRWVSLKAQGGW
jgi:DNA repair protein RadC